jgi:hypothetical protein
MHKEIVTSLIGEQIYRVAKHIADRIEQNGQEQVSIVSSLIQQPNKSKVAEHIAETELYLICEGEVKRQDFQTEAIKNAGVLLSPWRFNPIPCNGSP